MEPFYRNEYRSQLEDIFIEKELDDMSDEKALELLLLFSLPINKAAPLSEKLIEHFGSLFGVLNANYDELIEIGGTDKDSAVLIALVKDLYNRANANSNSADGALCDSDRAVAFFEPYLRFRKSESLYAAALDGSFDLIKLTEIERGSARFDSKTAEKAADFAKGAQAASLIVAYNIDGGSLFPDNNAAGFAKALNEKLAEEDIELNDIIVIGPDSELAFSEDLRLAVYLCK